MEFRIKSQKVRVNIPDRAALFAAVQERFVAGQGFALATINLDHLVKMRRSEDFLVAYVAQNFVVADGNPIVWLSRLAKQPVELLPGSELVLPLAELAAQNGVSVALLGSTAQTLAAAATGLQARVAGLQIATQIAPPFGFDPNGTEADAMFEALRESGAGLCFLALGAPKQEVFAARGRDLAPNIGFVSIGAGLDFIAGSQTRAPVWVRRLALEWLWRMLLSPRRLFGRYASCAAILPGLAIEASKQSRSR